MDRINGICVPVWHSDFMNASGALHRCRRLGAKWVQLVTHHYIETAVPYEGGPITATANTASVDSLLKAINLAHSLGLKVMLKPHVDWTRGGWRGYFYFRDDAAMIAWAGHYSNLIADYTQLAMVSGAEALCLGCEYADLNKNPAMAGLWTSLVAQVRREGYSRPLTYAANWGYGEDAEYNRPGLAGVWQELDFIGVDAYYPLSVEARPTLQQLRAGWTDAVNPWWQDYHQNHTEQLSALSKRSGKPVVFTEIGYPATDYAARNPGGDPGPTWAYNEMLQADCYRAVFDTVAKEPWFGGALWWQGGPNYNQHQLFMRPAGEVLRSRWRAPAN